MFNFGLTELIVIFGIALIVIGPEQLPEVAKYVARLLNELKSATSDLGKSLADFKNEADKIKHQTTDQFTKGLGADGIKSDWEKARKEFDQIKSSVEGTVSRDVDPNQKEKYEDHHEDPAQSKEIDENVSETTDAATNATKGES